MLDQDTALALVTIADEAQARVVLVGDRHQLPAVGRGGVLDLATHVASDGAKLSLDVVHRFEDPEYAELSLLMRRGERPGEVFDRLLVPRRDPHPRHRRRTTPRPRQRTRADHRRHPRPGRQPERRHPSPPHQRR